MRGIMFGMGLERQVAMARRHRDFEERLVGIVLRQARQSPALVRAQATKESRQLFNCCRQVEMEAHRLTCFLRLEINRRGILWAEHTPQHEVEDILVDHFLYRFPLFVVAIGSRRGTFVGRGGVIQRFPQPVGDVVKRLEQELPVQEILRDIDLRQPGLWEAFYESQHVKEKPYRGLFARNIPKQFLKMGSFAVEAKTASRSKGLDHYLKINNTDHR